MNKRPPLRRSAPIEAENDGVIEGRNAVIEALRAGTAIPGRRAGVRQCGRYSERRQGEGGESPYRGV